jgi:hypothetical protein
MTKLILPTKDKLVDVRGHPLTQALFLEIGYTDYAQYTLKEDDWEYEGRIFPSLKKLYLAEDDPTEYDFANKYLLNWNHWQRISENRAVRKHIDDWREELEIRIRSQAVKQMLANSRKGGLEASKWVANRGWAQKGAGRPSKADIESEKRFLARVSDEYSADVVRLNTGT